MATMTKVVSFSMQFWRRFSWLIFTYGHKIHLLHDFHILCNHFFANYSQFYDIENIKNYDSNFTQWLFHSSLLLCVWRS